MNVLVLSRNRESYSTRRLRSAAIRRGHVVRVADTLDFTIFTERSRPSLALRGRPLNRPDAVIPRIGASVTLFGTALVRQFEQMGVFCLNSAQAISASRDKLRSMQVLSRHDIGIPPSAFVHERADVLAAIERVGGPPVVIKVLEGTQGVGVILAETTKVAEAILETLHAARQQVLIQKFVAESRGRDLRAFVVGGRVVAAMRRIAQGDEFRSNVHRGARSEPVTLEEESERCALAAAGAMGLDVAGVDMLEAADGPLVMEVNSSPGLEGIEKTTGADVAGAIVTHLEEQAAFPEVDIKERLRVGAGYQVAEVTVAAGSPIAGLTLAASDLAARGVRVLGVRRGASEVPNPGGSTVVLAGDVLLCHGSRQELRRLLRR